MSPDALRKVHNQNLIEENSDLRHSNIALRNALHQLRERQLERLEELHDRSTALHDLLQRLLTDLETVRLEKDRLLHELTELRKKRE